MVSFKEYDDEDNLRVRGSFVNGLKEGTWIYYFENGRQEKELTFKNGVKHGKFHRWFSNGNLAIDSEYFEGKSHGPWKEYYENGNIKEIGLYHLGEYQPKDSWNEQGIQTLENGTGFKIESFGASGSDVYKHHYENGKLTREEKLSSLIYRGFVPDNE